MARLSFAIEPTWRYSVKVGDVVRRLCENCVYCRAIPISKSNLCTVYNRNTRLEDSCEHFTNVAIKGKFSEIERLLSKETKGIHPEPSEDSLLREPKKEKHSPECKWHKDWHACDCGTFDKEEK
jgi:hypothetical protein